MISVKSSDLPGDPRQPDELMRLGWEYHDIPWCKEADWNLIMGIIGAENMKLLATSIRRPSKDQRGQLLLSPIGRSNLVGFLKAIKKGK